MSGYWGIQILRRVGAWHCHRKLSGVHRSRQRRLREQMRVRTGGGGGGKDESGKSRDMKKDTTAQGGAKGRTALLGAAVPGLQPQAKPHPTSQSPLEQPMCQIRSDQSLSCVRLF